ncbi:C5 cytosine-specific DNA methylase superfamily protein [Pandoravirus kuranda]|uniref:Cytosine-specific methyltransferase n=1 Tax=Pandoravirus kuranda TaxID=3019033 RepID=A0AA95EFC7_9VIRU|nr:C5 cytosine-specific DNA methylase superfamily protein [Pandoravirus kuranda]
MEAKAARAEKRKRDHAPAATRHAVPERKRRAAARAGSMTAASLFCGAGGLDLGFEAAGFKVIVAVDKDRDAVQTYRNNVAPVAVVADLLDYHLPPPCALLDRNMNGGHDDGDGGVDNNNHNDNDNHDDNDNFDRYDVLIGGPPCQGFSIGGRMDVTDNRSALVWEFVRLVGEASPRTFVMENVAALATHTKWRPTREALVAALAAHGYDVAWCLVDAKDFDVPQTRKRAFLIGLALDKGGIQGAQSAQTVVDGVLERRVVDRPPPTVRQALAGMPPPGVAPNSAPCHARVTLARRPDLRATPYAGHLFNGGGRPLDPDAPSGTLLASMGGNRTPVIDVAATMAAVAASDHGLHRGNDTSTAVAVTITPWFVACHAALCAGTPAPPVPPDRVRRLTVAEAAALQTFPRGFAFAGSQSSQYRQVGNAVPPRLARALADALAGVLASASTPPHAP